jgi:hypothetical protein
LTARKRHIDKGFTGFGAENADGKQTGARQYLNRMKRGISIEFIDIVDTVWS